MAKVALVLNCRKTGAHALKVLAGALEIDPVTDALPLHFAKSLSQALAVTRAALEHSAQVVVAWSFYSPDFRAIAAELAAFKRGLADPRLVHLAGGVHATAEPEQTLAAGFDYAALGEGEHVLIDFSKALAAGGEARAVRGIAYRADGEVVRNGRGALAELDAFPPFAVKHRRFGPIEITRGCIYGCKFCATPFMNKARFRHRSIANVCHYAAIMKANGLRDYRFITPTALSYGSDDEAVHLDALEELLASVRAVIGPKARLYFGTFPSELRPEHVTPEALALLKRYVDNDNIIIGGQSGSEDILRSSRRGHDVEAIERAVRYAREAGFSVNVDFLFGLPGETERDVGASLWLAQKLTDLGARIHAHTFMPLPGTPYRYADPGRIAPEVIAALDRLSSERRLYGQWRRQIRLAAEIAERRAAY